MLAVAEMGGVILPPVPAFYHLPKTIDDLVNQTVGKVLDQWGLEARLFRRWSGAAPARNEKAPRQGAPAREPTRPVLAGNVNSPLTKSLKGNRVTRRRITSQ
jgi:hypothetical protein